MLEVIDVFMMLH